MKLTGLVVAVVLGGLGPDRGSGWDLKAPGFEALQLERQRSHPRPRQHDRRRRSCSLRRSSREKTTDEQESTRAQPLTVSGG